MHTLKFDEIKFQLCYKFTIATNTVLPLNLKFKNLNIKMDSLFISKYNTNLSSMLGNSIITYMKIPSQFLI